MSDEQDIVEKAATALITDRDTDLSDQDMLKVVKYQEAGLPGLGRLEESSLHKIMELYLGGKTYRQISRIMNIDKEIIMYLSHKYQWYPKKMEYFAELENTIRHRVVEAKIASHDFLIQLTHFWQHKIGKKVNRYLATGDEVSAEEVTAKDVAIYLKAVETLDKLGQGRNSGDKAPAVGLNLGDGVTIKKMGDNEVEITPKQKTLKEMMRQMAESKREEQRNNVAKSSDIDNNDNKDDPA